MTKRCVWVGLALVVGCGSGSSRDAGPGDAGMSADAGGAAGGQSGGGTGGSQAGGGQAGGASGGGLTAGGSAGGSGMTAGGGAGPMDGGVVALAGGDTCDVAPDITAGGRFAGTTNGFADDYSVSGAGCPAGGAASGRDVAYRITTPAQRQYTVRVTPVPATLPDGGANRFDPMLLVQRACGPGACVAGTVLNGPGDPESVTFSIGAGETMYVIVDGENVSRGEFELEVSF